MTVLPVAIFFIYFFLSKFQSYHLILILWCYCKNRKAPGASAGRPSKDEVDYEDYDHEEEEDVLLPYLDSEVEVKTKRPALPAKDYP